jgi:hypothetical protein
VLLVRPTSTHSISRWRALAASSVVSTCACVRRHTTREGHQPSQSLHAGKCLRHRSACCVASCCESPQLRRALSAHSTGNTKWRNTDLTELCRAQNTAGQNRAGACRVHAPITLHLRLGRGQEAEVIARHVRVQRAPVQVCTATGATQRWGKYHRSSTGYQCAAQQQTRQWSGAKPFPFPSFAAHHPPHTPESIMARTSLMRPLRALFTKRASQEG